MTSALSTTNRPDTGRRAPVATRYRLAADHTTVDVSTRRLGRTLRGTFHGVSGAIELSPELTRSQVDVALRFDRFSTGRDRRDGRLLAGLGVDDGAVVAFRADRLVPIVDPLVTADGTRPLWRLLGIAQVAGVRSPVDLALGPLHFGPGRETLWFSASGELHRDVLGLTGVPMLGERVHIAVTGRADRH